MVLTRSQSGDRRDDDERARFVREQARATAAHRPETRRADNIPEPRPGPSGLPLESPDSPEDVTAWRGDLDRHLQQISGRHTERLVEIDTTTEHTEARPLTTGRAPLNVTFSGAAQEPPRAPSVHSNVTNVSERRRREVRLAALEQRKKIDAEEQRIVEQQQEMARKQLANLRRQRETESELEELRRQQIEDDEQAELAGTQTAGPSPAEKTRRIDDWLTGVPAANAEPPLDHERPSSPPRPPPTPSQRERSSSRSRAIDRTLDRLTDHISTMMRPVPKHVYELPTFAGEPSEWLTFYNAYYESTMRYNYTAYDNISRLRLALKGEARQCVQHMLASSARPSLIIRVLKKNFGRTDLLIDRAIDELKRMPPLGPTACDLNTFATKVMNIVSTLVDLDKRSYGANPLLIREVTERLSPHLRSRWCAYAREKLAKSPASNELMLMAEFLMEESDAEMEFSHARAPKKSAAPAATTSARGKPRAPKPPRSTRLTGATHKDYSYTVHQLSCLCCGGTHQTTACYKLQSMTAGARWDWARLNKICYRCLESKHRRNTCPAPICSAPGCPYRHHPLLHVDQTTAPDASSQASASHQASQYAAPHMPQRAPAPYAQYAPAPPQQSQHAQYGPPTAPARAPRAHAPAFRARAPIAPRAPAAFAKSPVQPASDENTSERVQALECESAFTSNTDCLLDLPLDCPSDCLLDRSDSAKTVLLKIVPIVISGPRGERHSFALLDPGSTVSLIDEQLSSAIGATGDDTASRLQLQGVGAMTTTQMSKRITATIRGQHGGLPHEISLRSVRNLGLRSQRAKRGDIQQYEHLKDLDMACYAHAQPYVLIGADNWHLMLQNDIRMGKINEPAAMLTPLGWTVFGTLPTSHRQTHCPERVMHCHDIDSQLKEYFAIDALGIAKIDKKSPEDLRAEQIFQSTVKKTDGPHYEVGQLWRDEEPLMPPSYQNALKRLTSIERKMAKDEKFRDEYSAQIENLIKKGYASPAKKILDEKAWYLPHFAVTNPNKPGKIRLVFDAAATNQGQCLNDFILEGPDKLQSLIGILLRFREGDYAVTADIAEMFLRIKIREADRPSQLFLWRTDPTKIPTIFQMNSMIFGAASSPFLAHSVRDYNANANAAEYPLAVNEITRNHYMDDFVASFQSEEEAIIKSQQVAASHAAGGFTLRGWSSNSKRLLSTYDPELHADTPATLGGNKSQKILGMKWSPEEDALGFNTSMIRVPIEVKEGQRVPTKREALSAVMSIYDPLGLISQYVITAKLIIQRLWALKTQWDEELPQDEANKFSAWLENLKYIETLRVPRQLATSNETQRQELHIFVDGSTQAYAAAAYWRAIKHETIEINLIAAKAKVVPIKPLSVPRIELQAALIGARLMKTITQEKTTQPDEIFIWSDSRTVLHWVRNNASRYSVYVSHRLGEIAELTQTQQWRWVPTKENPADDATRGDEHRTITSNDRWYSGPDFLRRPSSEWPREIIASPTPNETEEKTGGEEASYTTRPVKWESPLPDINRFSKYDRLIGATARVLQFTDSLKKKQRIALQSHHIKRAEHMWLQQSQRESFPNELQTLASNQAIADKSRLYKLDPFIDEDGLMKMRGRINAAPVDIINKKPTILDGRNQFVRLYLQREHERAAHANNERVVNDVRQKFWVLRLRPSIRTIASTCRLCYLRRTQPHAPAFGDLPVARLTPYQRPFTYAATDYFGPLWVTIGRRREKRWVALFTCLTTRAVHLELVHTLSTDSALMALRRLAARRGWPQQMWSDNATNFRAASSELRAAYNEWAPTLQRYGLTRGLEWHFIAPGAPNQGGAWERLVRSVKNALSATLHTRAPKEEVLKTLLTEAEHTVNARPLTHVSVDATDDEALTPLHFLLGGSTTVPLTGPCAEADRSTWRATQALADHFWSRWVKEYLPLLAPRQSSSNRNEREIQPGDYVLIVDSTLPRNVWPRGIVVATHPGPDGRTRNVEVRTRGGVFRRPTSRLVVLRCNEVELSTGGVLLTTASSNAT